MRVFFIGAGASKDMTRSFLPTMSEFFLEKDFNDSNKPEENVYNLLNWFIHENMNFFKNEETQNINKTPLGTPLDINLEKLFNYLFICLNPPADVYHYRGTISAYTELLTIPNDLIDPIDLSKISSYQKPLILKSILSNIQEQLYSYMIKRLGSSPNDCDAAIKLVEALEADDCLITTNYDLLMDKALKKSNKKEIRDRSQKLLSGGRGSPESRNGGLYLKLHGSLNWFVCPNANCPNHFSIATADEFDRPHFCERCGNAFQRLIVPPVFYKNIENYPKLKFIWDKAFEKLSRADEIIFYGFSFASSDMPISWLIREACRIEKPKRERNAYSEVIGSQKIINKVDADNQGRRKTHEEVILPKIIIINKDGSILNKVEQPYNFEPGQCKQYKTIKDFCNQNEKKKWRSFCSHY